MIIAPKLVLYICSMVKKLLLLFGLGFAASQVLRNSQKTTKSGGNELFDSSFLNTKSTPAVKNNNPGNIRPSETSLKYEGVIGVADSGKSGEFLQFATIGWGAAAQLRLLRSYLKNGYNTIHKIIYRWCPPIECDSDKYVRYIVSQTGIDRNKVLTFEPTLIIPIAMAMARWEADPRYVKATPELYQAAWDKV